jgi:hypothetical protein
MTNYLKSEPESLQGGFEVVRSVDKERRLLDLLFLAEFAEKQHSELRGSGLKQPEIEEFVILGLTAAYSQCRSSLI